jgi:hypothetical protein
LSDDWNVRIEIWYSKEFRNKKSQMEDLATDTLNRAKRILGI